MGMEIQSSFTHTIYKFQCDFQKNHGQDASLQGLVMRHLVGRIITIGVTLLLHAEAVCKVAAACFSAIKQVFAMTNEELISTNFNFETSKSAYDHCLKSFKAIFYREVLDTETFQETISKEPIGLKSIETDDSPTSWSREHSLESHSYESPSYSPPFQEQRNTGVSVAEQNIRYPQRDRQAPTQVTQAVLEETNNDTPVNAQLVAERLAPQLQQGQPPINQATHFIAPYILEDETINSQADHEQVQFFHSGSRIQPQISQESLMMRAPQPLVDDEMNNQVGDEDVLFLHSGSRAQPQIANQSLMMRAPPILDDAPLNGQNDQEQVQHLHSGSRAQPQLVHQSLAMRAPLAIQDAPLNIPADDEQIQFVRIPTTAHRPMKSVQTFSVSAPQNIDDPLLNPVAEEQFVILQMPAFSPRHQQLSTAQAATVVLQQIPTDDLLHGVQEEVIQFPKIPQTRLQPGLQIDVLFRPPSPIEDDPPVLIQTGDDIELQTQLPHPKLPQHQQNLAIDEQYFSGLSAEMREKLSKVEEDLFLDHENTLKSLSETTQRASQATFPSTVISFVSGDHIQPNAQWQVARGIVGNYNIGGCHFTNGVHGVEHLVSQFEIKIKNKTKTIPLIAIFDPQGSKAAEFLRVNLVKCLKNHLEAFNQGSLSPEGIYNGISFAFSQLQQVFLQRFPTLASHGSTATFVLELDDRLWIGSVGSTGAVLSNAGQALQCSEIDLQEETGFGFSGARTFKPKITCYQLQAIKGESHLILGTSALFKDVGTNKLAEWAYANRKKTPEEIAKGITFSVARVKPQSLACFVMSLDSIDWERI